jgi:phosphoglycerate dehydrogenase-like enzyme
VRVAEPPTVLLDHTVEASHWADADEIEAAILAAVPEIELRVARTPPESAAVVGESEVVLSAGITTEVLDSADRLRWVQALSAGVDYYPLERLRSMGVTLTSAAGIHAEPIAQQVLGYVLVFERRIHRGIRQQASRVWERYEGGEVTGKTLGIIGVGEIGSKVAEYGRTFGMTVLGTKRDTSTVPEAVDEIFPPEGLFELLSRSDYVVVACPLTDETEGMLGAAELGAMRASAFLVNVARGPIVEEAALITALQQHAIGGAALDVHRTEPYPADSPLWDLSNVVLTPHMAGSTPRKAERIADVVAGNYRAYVDDDPDGFRNRVV